MTPITYPARPINGGPFPKARAKVGSWAYEPKYNGWRALVHLESGAMFNRQGERLSIEREFDSALACLRLTLDAKAFKWADVEALERRHGIGQGCLILLDVIPEPAYDDATYVDRRIWTSVCVDRFVNPKTTKDTGLMPDDSTFALITMPPRLSDPMQAWTEMQDVNAKLGCEFYEGLVAKRLDSRYPVQLRNPEEAFPFWSKHRFI